jgi:hypothetical protein
MRIERGEAIEEEKIESGPDLEETGANSGSTPYEFFSLIFSSELK